MAINVKDKLVTVESLGIAYSTEQGARQEADQALSTRIDNIVAPDGDPSLTEVSDARVSGSTTHNTLKARLDADQAAVGTEIAEIKADLDALEERAEALEGSGGGLTSDIKSALMNLVNHIAWDDDDPTGQTYITALQNALYPPADLVSISAVYTQSSAIYETNELDDLKEDLVVTALMSDQTTRPVTDYTLSGTLTEGTSTITVTYGGKTTTFTVTVSHEAIYVKNLVEEGTLLREHAWGTNDASTNPLWNPSVYSISNVRSGDVLNLPNGWNSANWSLVRNIGKTNGADSIPDCTQGESWIQSGHDYGYYPITMNEDVETLYISFNPTYGNVATWTREGGF